VSRLDAATAGRFARVALANVARPYPHKLDHLLDASGGELDHRRLHPAFYGSYDWHSAVHMHWTLARIQRLFPSREIAACLDHHLNEKAMAAELAYFRSPAGQTFERPYGWAWLLKLHAELAGTPWEAAVAPLASEIAARFGRLLQAPYPIRAGSHGNTAFACLLALAHEGLRSSIGAAARRWYLGDRDAPVAYEPSLDDFLSPTLVEAALMKEVLPPAEFSSWLSGYASDFGPLEKAPSGFDRSDAKQVHLDGLSLSRAWCLRRLGYEQAADKLLAAALPHVAGDYVGEHWLASFALLAMGED
jgi:hypothetical protein